MKERRFEHQRLYLIGKETKPLMLHKPFIKERQVQDAGVAMDDQFTGAFPRYSGAISAVTDGPPEDINEMPACAFEKCDTHLTHQDPKRNEMDRKDPKSLRNRYFLDLLAKLIPTFHVRVSARTKEGKMQSYVEGVPFYYERDQAVAVGEKAFAHTKDVIMVEVFQSGIARPIAFFQ